MTNLQSIGDGAPLLIPKVDIDPFEEQFLLNPYAYHDALRDPGPVVWLSRYNIFAMARYEEVRSALIDHETFLSGRGVGLSDFAKEEPWRPPSLLLEVDPPLHDRTRSIMQSVVSPASLKTLEPVWTSKAAALVDQLVKQGGFDAVSDLSEAFPMLIFPDAVGLMEEGRENLLVYAATVFNAFGPRNRLLTESMNTAREASAWVASACKRENLREDGWGAAVYEAADNGACTQEEAQRLLRSLLSAGVDTTVNGIATVIYALTQFPEQWKKLRENPRLVRKAGEESLRWDSTVQTFFRTTAREVAIGDTLIPKHTKVLLFLGAANRDPRKWENPDRFDITRNTSGHVGFGAGIHQCLGQMIARLETQFILSALVEKCQAIIVDGPVLRRANNTLHALKSLPVRVTPSS
ncbi:cytochrome P450 [Hyphococcus sp.]|uniref:cytochrome P450 n=1 Tax=Hyphococcus sp. TaxID=2038636 RepID=UPI003CCBB899